MIYLCAYFMTVIGSRTNKVKVEARNGEDCLVARPQTQKLGRFSRRYPNRLCCSNWLA